MVGGLEGRDVMGTRLELPGVWMRWAVLLSLAGLPIAAVLSWIFDWTSEGVVRTARADSVPEHARPLPPSMKQRTVTWLALLALLASVGWLGWRGQRYRKARAQLGGTVPLAGTGQRPHAPP